MKTILLLSFICLATVARSADFVITIDDEKIPALVAAVCEKNGYKPTLEIEGKVQPNPETPKAFAMRKIQEKLNDLVRAVVVDSALKAAAQSAKAQAPRVTLSEGDKK